jgi:hypothetical protein
MTPKVISESSMNKSEVLLSFRRDLISNIAIRIPKTEAMRTENREAGVNGAPILVRTKIAAFNGS